MRTTAFRLIIATTVLLVIFIFVAAKGCAIRQDKSENEDSYLLAGTSGSGVPGKVTSPNPVNGVTYISITQELTWEKSNNAASYDVYFGLTNPPPYITNTALTFYNPGVLSFTTTYYWRIDARNNDDINEGDVWSFQTYGGWTQTSTPSGGLNSIIEITADSDYLYVLGDEDGLKWRIEKRWKISGALVSGFGLYTEGVVTSNPSATAEMPWGIALDNDYLYIAGDEDNFTKWRIEKRYKGDGQLVPGFGTAGAITETPSAGENTAMSIVADDSYLYIAGYDESPGTNNNQWRIEKRSKISGTLVSEFGLYTEGVVTSNPSVQNDSAWNLTTDDTYLYVTGMENGGTAWRIEKRAKSDGQLDASFGNSGVITETLSGTDDEAFWVRSDADYLYIVGYETIGAGDTQWRIEKRSKISGALVLGFGLYTEGVVTSNPSAGTDWVCSISVDNFYLYITGRDESPGVNNAQWRTEKRAKNTGALVNTFGSNGIIQNNISSGNDIPYTIISDGSFIYIGGDSNGSQWRIEKRIKETGGQ